MTFDDDNRLATFSGSAVTNDLDGNMVWGPLTNNTFASYAFNARNALLATALSGNQQISYAYDPAGNRTALTNGADVTRFVTDPNAKLPRVLMRTKSGTTNFYIYGPGLLYEITATATSTTTRTYHFDLRGSTIALTDANGNVTDRIEYSAYGSTRYRSGTNDTPFLFNGRYGVQTDPNGLLYMRARYYNPYICRFINADPSGFSGVLNFFAFADGNPISLLDPFGLATQGESTGRSFLSQFAYEFGQAIQEDEFQMSLRGRDPQRYEQMYGKLVPAKWPFAAGGNEPGITPPLVMAASFIVPALWESGAAASTMTALPEAAIAETRIVAAETGANRLRLNIFGEGEAPGFVDVSSSARYANGRPLTSTFGDGSATDIFIRSAPISGENTIPEILRLSQPGTRITLMQPTSGFQGQALINAFGSRATVNFSRAFPSQTAVPGINMTILRMTVGGVH
jgi:RHS repeat-associated protein